MKIWGIFIKNLYILEDILALLEGLGNLYFKQLTILLRKRKVEKEQCIFVTYFCGGGVESPLLLWNIERSFAVDGSVKKINYCRVSHLIYGILLWQHKQMKTGFFPW